MAGSLFWNLLVVVANSKTSGQKPRLLLVSPRFLLPADSGGKIRTGQILKRLRGGHFHVTLASPAPSPFNDVFQRDLATLCDQFVSWPERPRHLLSRLRRWASLFSRLPVSVAEDVDRRGAALVRSALAECDLVVFDFPHSAVLAPETLSVPSLLFTHNVEGQIFERHVDKARAWPMRWLWVNQARKMNRYEARTVQAFDQVVAVSTNDAEQLQKRYGLKSVAIIPSGVDLTYFSYAQPVSNQNVVFTGAMDWFANIEAMTHFLEAIWPLVLQRFPDAQMTVVGRRPPQRMRNRFENDGCRFTGFVDDIRPYIRAAAVYVIPIRVGSGTRIKAFEAMALGCPVVATSIGVEGLDVTADEHYLNADGDQAFANAIGALLSDGERARRLSEAARQHLEASYSNDRVAQVFEDICVSTLAAGEARPS